MTKEAKTRLLCEAPASITRIDSAIRPRADDTAAQIRQHGACDHKSKTNSL